MRKILSMFAALLFAFVAYAAEVNVSAGNNTLRSALSSASPGDVLVLGAGTYTDDNYIEFTKNVELKPAADAATTPVIQIGTYIKVYNGASVKISDIKLDGSQQGSRDQIFRVTDDNAANSLEIENCEFTAGKKPMFRVESGKKLSALVIKNCKFTSNTGKIISNEGIIGRIEVKDCEVSGNGDIIIKGSSTSHTDSCIVDNCYFHNNTKQSIYFDASSTVGTQSCDKLVVTNSTFVNTTALTDWISIVDIRPDVTTATDAIKVVVDHCTFYNNPTVDSGHANIRPYKLSDVTISNCIFALPEELDLCATYCNVAGGTIENCIAYNYGHNKTDNYGHAWGATITACTIDNPLFVNAAEGNLTLGEGSPALTMNDGQPIGDPRWWPAAPVPPTPQPVYQVDTLQYTGSTTTNMVGNGANNAATVGLDADVFTVLADKGSSSNLPGLNKDHDIRLYAETNSGNGNIITVSIANNGTIHSIALDIKQTATFVVKAGETAVTEDEGVYAINGTSFSIQNTTKGATTQLRLNKIIINYTPGVPPAVVNPVITADAFFYDTTLVTITCATEGAAIYYTLDGTEPTAASTQYTAAFKLSASATVKAIAILASDASEVVEKTLTKNPSFASFEALIAAELPNNTLVEVSFADVLIDSIYANKDAARKGVYFTVGGKAYEIYYSNGDVVIPAEWVAGGKVSGTIRGNWTEYKGLWEIVPTAPWTWAALTYAAPTPVVPVQYCALATGHQNNPEFGDPNGRILLTIKKGEGNNIIVAIKNNNEAGNPKTGLNYLWVNAQGATAVARYGDGTHDEADVEEVSVVVEFNEAKETYNFINIHWAYSGWTGEWAIDGLDVAASELCPGSDPVVGATNYYLVGSMNNWTPGLTDDFGQNPGAEGEYMAKATLAVGDEFKVIGITSGVLNPDTTWYPEGTNNNYVVDVDHAGAAKNIYFRPDGQGGEGWHYGVIFVEPNQDALKAVSDSTTWNFSKLTQDTLNSLYNKSDDAIKLSGETTPSTADELIYANYDSLWTIAAEFDGEAIAFTGQYPIRKNQFCQNGVLRIKTTVAGNIYVKFSDTGSKASETAVKRYLMVNGDSTEYWASREKTGEGAYPAQLNVETGAIHVPAGDVTIKGSSAIVVYYVTFVPDAAPIVNYYVAGSMNGWKADENYMLTPNNESLYEGEFTFAANDAFKVIGYDGSNTTWYPAGTNNDYKITEAGDYKITFNPAGNVEGWYEGYFNVVMKEAPIDTIPTTAPAAPTAAEDDVMAIYCNHYATNNLHFEILGWGGVTTWHADTIDGVAIVHCQDMKYEFLTNWGAASYDMSAYKKLHADLWAPAASTIRLGIEALGANDGGSGFKSGVVCTLAEGWNSIDIEFSQEPDLANYSFTDVKYIFFEWYKTPEGESFENNPFGFANIYFYDKAPEGIENLFVEGKAVKVLYNGQILILKNNKVYTVTGQPVNMK